jgi:hypothetical protein
MKFLGNLKEDLPVKSGLSQAMGIEIIDGSLNIRAVFLMEI